MPFFFASGYGRASLPAAHRERVPLTKPYRTAICGPRWTPFCRHDGHGRARRPAKKGPFGGAHLIVFALAVAAPLLLLVGVLLYRSVTLENEQVNQRIGQVLEALIADLDRDMDRRIAILETLSTSPLLAAEDWPAFYAQAKDNVPGAEGTLPSCRPGHSDR